MLTQRGAAAKSKCGYQGCALPLAAPALTQGALSFPAFPAGPAGTLPWSRMRRGMCGELTQVPLWALGSTRLGDKPQCCSLSPPMGQESSGVQCGAVGCSSTCLAGEPRPAGRAGAAAREGAVATVLARHLAESCKRDQKQRHCQGWGSRAPSPATKGVCARSSPGRSGSIRPGKCLVLSSELCWGQISCVCFVLHITVSS